MKLSDALKFSRERKAWCLIEGSKRLYASDFGLTMHEETSPGSRVYEDVLQPWVDVDPQTRRFIMSSEEWNPVDPKSPLVILAEAVDDWREDG